VSPILVRPVREQFEHDRVIRLLQARWRRRYDVVANVGDERHAGVKVGPTQVYPDLIVYAPGRSRRPHTLVEVETSESVNNLEALAEWAPFGRAAAEFHLYVPASSADIARRLAADNEIAVTELWAYHAVGEEMRFALVHRAPRPAPARRAAASSGARAARPGARRGAKKTTRARRTGRARRRGSPRRRAARRGRRR
jgi:hypothetical protein